MKLITFTVPCYNSAAYMSHCIETLLPAGEDAEIILVDDGSRKEMGCMLKLHTLAEWMYGFLEPAPPYGLPEEMYNDVMPSGIHRYNRYGDGM